MVHRTAFRRASLRVQWRDQYPVERPTIELRSATLPDQVLEKIEMGLWKHWDSHDSSQRNLKLMILFLQQAIDKNRLLYAKEEIDRIQQLLDNPHDSLKANPKRGTIVIERTVKSYRSRVKITVPELYPSDPVQFQYVEGTFHPHLERIFQTRVEFLIQRIWKGYQYQLPSQKSGEEEEENTPAPEWTPSKSELHEIRHDLQFLKQMQDLKEQSHDKAMRRQQTRLVKAEITSMSEAERKQEELERQLELQQIQLDHDRRTLYPVAAFILVELLERLPHETCPECQLSLLPSTPPAAWSQRYLGEMEDKERVDRLPCDHWYHYRCVKKIMSRPPFDEKLCLHPGCGKHLQHNVFNIQFMRRMEQRYLKEEERQRELADIADFLT